MKRNSLLALGFGVLLGVGLLTPGCGDSNSEKKDASADAKKDVGGTDGPRAGGATGTGGARTGGTTGSGGARTGGTTGSGGARTGGTTGSGGSGVGGSGGTGGSALDGGLDTGKLDTQADQPKSDALDVPLINPEVGNDVPMVLDGAGIDGVSIDGLSIDGQGIDAPPAIDTAATDVTPGETAIDAEGLDGSID